MLFLYINKANFDVYELICIIIYINLSPLNKKFGSVTQDSDINKFREQKKEKNGNSKVETNQIQLWRPVAVI